MRPIPQARADPPAVNASVALVEHFKRAEPRAVRRNERHAENGFGAITGLAIDGTIDRLGIVRAAHAPRLAGLNHLPDDPGIIG